MLGRGKQLPAEPSDTVPLKLADPAAFETGVLNPPNPGMTPAVQAPPGYSPLRIGHYTMWAHVGCPVTKDHLGRVRPGDPAMPGTRGHAGRLRPSVKRAGTTCYVRPLL